MIGWIIAAVEFALLLVFFVLNLWNLAKGKGYKAARDDALYQRKLLNEQCEQLRTGIQASRESTRESLSANGRYIFELETQLNTANATIARQERDLQAILDAQPPALPEAQYEVKKKPPPHPTSRKHLTRAVDDTASAG